MNADIATGEFEPHRSLLFGIAYRMLGVVADAEDVLQDAWLRWQAVDRDAVRSVQAYLVTLTTRLCIDANRSARARREVYVGPWLPEPVPSGRLTATASPEQTVIAAESISYATMILLERLGPVERAVFLLRDVFDYDYREIAPIVGKTEAACRQVLHRARQHLRENEPRQQTSYDACLALTAGLLAATANGNLDGLLALLHDDATLISDGGGKAAAALKPIHGADRVARLMLGIARKSPIASLQMIELNGAPAVVFSVAADPTPSIMMFEERDGKVTRAFVVRNPDKQNALAGLS